MSRLLLFLMIFLTGFMKDDTVMSDGNTDKILNEERNVKRIISSYDERSNQTKEEICLH
jgi:hypothetical protein